jgi:hypothetical protein
MAETPNEMGRRLSDFRVLVRGRIIDNASNGRCELSHTTVNTSAGSKRMSQQVLFANLLYLGFEIGVGGIAMASATLSSKVNFFV